MASALTQLISRLAGQSVPALLVSGLPLALAGMAVAGLLLSQLSYRDAGLGAPLATVTLANPVASAGIAVLLLGARTAGGPWGVLAALAGGGLAAWGVVLLAMAEGTVPTRAERGTPARGVPRAPITPSAPPWCTRPACGGTARSRSARRPTAAGAR